MRLRTWNYGLYRIVTVDYTGGFKGYRVEYLKALPCGDKVWRPVELYDWWGNARQRIREEKGDVFATGLSAGPKGWLA